MCRVPANHTAGTVNALRNIASVFLRMHVQGGNAAGSGSDDDDNHIPFALVPSNLQPHSGPAGSARPDDQQGLGVHATTAQDKVG
jgi:hypothetical protein